MSEKGRQGFASMDPALQREIASRGGKKAHERGTAHRWTSEQARIAGRKGGIISRGGRGRAMPRPNVPPPAPATPVEDAAPSTAAADDQGTFE